MALNVVEIENASPTGNLVYDPETLSWVRMVQPVVNADTVVQFQTASESTSVSQIESSASVVTLCASNDSRKHLTIFNDSTAILYVKSGSGSSLTSYSVKVLAGGYYDVPDRYTGIVTGIWASANGYAYVTEYS